MISGITGKVSRLGSDWMVIETAGGVSYLLATTPNTIAQHSLGASANLLTHLIVREDQLSLYGFQEPAELNFFQQLISVSGVGPRMALAILGAGPINQIQTAIANHDVAILTTISGVGKKTAERILVELQNQMEFATLEKSGRDSGELLAALTQLGYNTYEVQRIAMDIPADIVGTEERIKYALKLLAK